MEVGVDINDSDIQSGDVHKIAAMIQAAGYKATIQTIDEAPYIESSAGGHMFRIMLANNNDHFLFVFLASFPELRFTLNDANDWNRDRGLFPCYLDASGQAMLKQIVHSQFSSLVNFLGMHIQFAHELEVFKAQFSRHY